MDHVPDASIISSHITSGTSEHYLQEDYANDMGRQNFVSYNDNTDTNTITGINTVNMSAPITYQETYHQADHILDNSRHNNNFSQYYNRGRNKSNTIHSANSIHCNNPKQGKDMIITISTGGYRGDHTWVGHILDDNDTDSQSNQMDNNMLNNLQGTGIHAFGKMSELTYAVTPRKDRELWCTWGLWAGGSPGTVNSTAGEGARQGELIRMDLTPTSMQEHAHRIAVLHEGTNPSIPAADPCDLQQPEEGMEEREVDERKGELVDPSYRPQ